MVYDPNINPFLYPDDRTITIFIYVNNAQLSVQQMPESLLIRKTFNDFNLYNCKFVAVSDHQRHFDEEVFRFLIDDSIIIKFFIEEKDFEDYKNNFNNFILLNNDKY